MTQQRFIRNDNGHWLNTEMLTEIFVSNVDNEYWIVAFDLEGDRRTILQNFKTEIEAQKKLDSLIRGK